MTAQGRGGGITPPRVVELIRGKVAQLGQSTVARDTGLTRQTVQRYMQGIGEPSEATLEKLAVYFKMSVAELREVGTLFNTGIANDCITEISDSVGDLLDQMGDNLEMLPYISRIMHATTRLLELMDATKEARKEELMRNKAFIEKVQPMIDEIQKSTKP